MEGIGVNTRRIGHKQAHHVNSAGRRDSLELVKDSCCFCGRIPALTGPRKRFISLQIFRVREVTGRLVLAIARIDELDLAVGARAFNESQQQQN
jgi:hypothetical protein